MTHCYLDARLFTCHNSKDCSEGPKEVEEVKDKREEEQVKIIDKILLDLHKHARRCGYICIYPRARPRALKHPKLHVATLDYQCLGRGDRVQSDYSVRRERWKREK